MGHAIKEQGQVTGRLAVPEERARDSRLSTNHSVTAVHLPRWKFGEEAPRRFGIIAFVVLGLIVVVGRTDAVCIGLDDAPISEHSIASWSNTWDGRLGPGEFLDRRFYDILDEQMYYYLDRWQYNLMGGLNYVLGHPAYPKLYERPVCGGVGFQSVGIVGCFSFYAGFGSRGSRGALSGGAVNVFWMCVPTPGYCTSFRSFGPGDYIDRRWYYYIDKGQYNYLDKAQYLLIGGLGYLFGRFPGGLGYEPWTQEGQYYRERQSACAFAERVPEPSTIAILMLGCLCLRGARPRRRFQGTSLGDA